MPKMRNTIRRKKQTLKKFGRLAMRVLAKLLSLGNRVIFLSGCNTLNTRSTLRLAELVNILAILKINKDGLPR